MISFELTGLPPMANGNKGGWQKKHRIAKAWKTRLGYMLMGKTPKVPWLHIRVVFTRFSSVEPDDDGLAHGFKPIRDALVEYGLVADDSRKHLASEYRWEKAPAKYGKIRVEIYPEA